MTLVVSPTFVDLFTKLKALIASIVPAGTIVLRGPVNRVPQPDDAHVVMTELFTGRLRTNVETYQDDPESVSGLALYEQGTAVHVQVDFYGSPAGEWAVAFETVFRSAYAAAALDPVCAPLHADEARMIPLVTGEQQYEKRYAVTAVLQYTPVVSTPQQFADQADVVLREVDVTYPP